MSTSKILSDSKHSLWPECFGIRNQLQKEEQKTTNLWRVNNKLLNPSWAKEEIKGEDNIQIKKKENGNISYQIFDLKSIILKMATMTWLFFLILLYFTTLVPIFPFTLPSSSPTCHSTVHPHTVVPFQGSLRHVLWRIPSPPRHHFHTTYPLEAVRLFLIYMILFLFCLLFLVFITFLLVVRSYQSCGLRRTW